MNIDWKQQHNGVHRASFLQLKESMPQVYLDSGNFQW